MSDNSFHSHAERLQHDPIGLRQMLSAISRMLGIIKGEGSLETTRRASWLSSCGMRQRSVARAGERVPYLHTCRPCITTFHMPGLCHMQHASLWDEALQHRHHAHRQLCASGSFSTAIFLTCVIDMYCAGLTWAAAGLYGSKGRTASRPGWHCTSKTPSCSQRARQQSAPDGTCMPGWMM